MAVSLKLGIKQSQRLNLTQSLRQSIEILQLSSIELAEIISEELQQNPVLEEEGSSTVPSVADADGAVDSANKELSGDESINRQREDHLLQYEDSSDSGLTSYYDDERKRKFLENAVAQEESLQQHLLAQAHEHPIDDRDISLFENIITAIDERGFVNNTTAEIAAHNDVSEDRVLQVLETIQLFEPVGCGVFSVQESLLVQARQQYPEDTLLHSILEKYFKELENLKYDEIAKKMRITIRDVIERSNLIQNLDPFPGQRYSSKKITYIIPEVEVQYIDGDIIITLNDDWVPSIRINSYYLNMMKKKNIEKKLKDYIQDKMQSARYLIKNVSSRRDTILRVVRAIMEHQKDFLISGPGNLNPLTHAVIAEEVGLHESTVSRTTTGKYVQTPWGVFELKYFFVNRIHSQSSTDYSSDRVMSLIKDIVAQEKPDKPYSDEDILYRLEKAGVKIARRTIAKYRDVLGIPASGKRKKLNMIKAEGEK
ncbi:MAG: RNA polymerase factor sigma-54 [Spirochaetota bacterium]